MFFSESTGGFYTEEYYGARKLVIDDPTFVWPQIEVENLEFDPEQSFDGPAVMIDDPDVVPPTIEIDNPECKIPADAVEITAEEYAALLAGEAAGMIITADEKGRPILIDPPPPSEAHLWAQYQAQAQAALDKTDAVAMRCWKAGVPYPAEWLSYTNALRIIVRAESGDFNQPLPQQPAYPAGT